uniref:Uncharacterized protein n=1 Tax=Lotharella globosa TaxID=91324 RepID=A0A7S3ZFC7_9EUKA
MGYRLKLPPIQRAQKLGLQFEICYAPAIRDKTLRRNTIANAAQLIRLLRGRDVVLSSGADTPFELRGPHDAMNLAILFGLTTQKAAKAISTASRRVLDRGQKNSRHRGVIEITRKDLKEKNV